jgi:hypothetical protein
MDEIPGQLVDGLSPDKGKEVAAWWAGLDDASRSHVADLCDPRQDESFFGAASDVPVVIGGRFVPGDDAAGWSEWHAELFDHLLSNPELVLFAPPVVRTFHVCTRHEAARAALAAGRIPADFQCPLGSGDCPLRRLLSVAPHQPRAALRLFGVRRLSSGPAGRGRGEQGRHP